MLDKGTASGGGASGDGLIDPEGFVTKSATLDTGAITGSASQLRTMGGEVKYRVEDVEKSWGGLGGCYEAPEQDRVYALMKPAADDAHGLNTVLRSAAGHLDTYAATLDGIKPRLADLERRARSFRSEVICGVRVDASEAKDASLGEKAVGLVDWVPGVDEGKKTVPWHEDPATAAKNSSLMKEYASLVEQVSSAAARCASDINALVERRQTTPSATTQAEALTDPGASLPWGSPATKGGTCPAVVGHGASVAGGGIAGGVGRIVGGVDLFDSETYGQAWAGATTVTGIAGLLTGGRGGGSQATSRGGSWTGRAAVIPVGRWAKGARDIGERTGANRVAVAGYTGAKGLMRMRNKIADDQAEWVNDKYKNHIAGLPPIQWSRAGLGATSDGLGAIETRAAWLARRTDSPFTANIPLATSRTASFFKDEVNRWDHILRDPKGWWDQASGLDKAGVAATFAPFGVLGKGLVKGAKEALGLGKHVDDVKKAPASPKLPDSGDTDPGSGRSGSDGGPRKSDPDASKGQGSDGPVPESGSGGPDGGRPDQDGGGDRAGSTADEGSYAATGHDRDEMPDWTTSEWMEERADVTVGGWGQMVGYDHQAATNGGDGWHKWKDDLISPRERQRLTRCTASILVDYKGGAAFAPFEGMPHLAGLIDNLADDPHLTTRARSSIQGEVVRRQQLLKDAGSSPSITHYRELRAENPDLPPMPHLFVVIDEFGELLTAEPDFIDLFLQIGRIGRSIGVHLLLSSQRIEGGKLRGLDTYLSYRLGLRTFDGPESQIVLGNSDAYNLPPLPGYGYLKVGTSVYTRFRSGYVSGAVRGPAPEQASQEDEAARPMLVPTYNGIARDDEGRSSQPARLAKPDTGRSFVEEAVDQVRDDDRSVRPVFGCLRCPTGWPWAHCSTTLPLRAV